VLFFLAFYMLPAGGANGAAPSYSSPPYHHFW